MRRSRAGLLQGLDGHAQFHRDNALGRIFHPGTRSYRQRSALDSVHLAVHPDNRVSVHVDRVSPLVVRTGRRCRYSVVRALVHNVVAAAEAVGHLAGRRWGRQRCELDCKIVWVPDDPTWEDAAEDGDEDCVA
ncbi:MAG: hypothetical protein ACRD12_19745 [Acidimicrobiales bacterium]